VSKKSSAAVSSWGFSGYLIVLPRIKKPILVKDTKKTEGPSKAKTEQKTG
jgi:hypothetical protein